MGAYNVEVTEEISAPGQEGGQGILRENDQFDSSFWITEETDEGGAQS